MTTTPARPRAARLSAAGVAALTARLERDFGRLPESLWDPRHHYLLDALDRGEHDRFVVWPERDPVTVLHLGVTGTVVAAGDPAGAHPLAAAAERARWRILIGDEPVTRAILEAATSGWWRRRPNARVQRFMTADAQTVVAPATPLEGFRRAVRADLDDIVEHACRLHVEDRMGPPIVGAARQGVRSRMADSIARGTTWVVQQGGRAVAKVDLSLNSPRRGAQIAGVYVDPDRRGQGIATGMIATLTHQLLERGLPVVSLHVRADNAPAITAYERAGFVDRGPWLLALR